MKSTETNNQEQLWAPGEKEVLGALFDGARHNRNVNHAVHFMRLVHGLKDPVPIDYTAGNSIAKAKSTVIKRDRDANLIADIKSEEAFDGIKPEAHSGGPEMLIMGELAPAHDVEINYIPHTEDITVHTPANPVDTPQVA